MTLRRRIEKLEAQRQTTARRACSGFVIRMREAGSPSDDCSSAEEWCPETGQMRTVIYLNPGDENL
jgi:hypothetical protein